MSGAGAVANAAAASTIDCCGCGCCCGGDEEEDEEGITEEKAENQPPIIDVADTIAEPSGDKGDNSAESEDYSKHTKPA